MLSKLYNERFVNKEICFELNREPKIRKLLYVKIFIRESDFLY